MKILREDSAAHVGARRLVIETIAIFPKAVLVFLETTSRHRREQYRSSVRSRNFSLRIIPFDVAISASILPTYIPFFIFFARQPVESWKVKRSETLFIEEPTLRSIHDVVAVSSDSSRASRFPRRRSTFFPRSAIPDASSRSASLRESLSVTLSWWLSLRGRSRMHQSYVIN